MRGQPGPLTRVGGRSPSSTIRLAVASARGEITNRLPARVSAFSCHQPMVSPPRETLTPPSRAAQTPGMRTYRELFRTPEFTPLFLTSSVQVAASVVGLGLGTLIYLATRSPLLSALAMFGPSLAQLIGATSLLSAADRLPPRAVLAGLPWSSRWAPPAWPFPGCPCGRPSPSSWASARSPRWAAACATGCSTRSFPAELSAGPLGAEHVRGRHADLRFRGRRRPGGHAVRPRRAAGRGRAVPRRRGHRLVRPQPPAAAGRRAAVGPRRPGGTTRGCGPSGPAATCISRCGCRTG